MKVDNSAQIRNRIEELKREKHAVILAHYSGSRISFFGPLGISSS